MADLEGFVTVGLHVLEETSQLLGDTGFSLSDSARPQTLERWMSMYGLPEQLNRLTQGHPVLSGLQGLLRMRLSCATPEDSVWILARAAENLVCILVRRAGDDSAAQLNMHASFLQVQAHRYCCEAALLLLEGCDCGEELEAFHRFVLVHHEAPTVTNRLYEIPATRPRLFCAYLI